MSVRHRTHPELAARESWFNTMHLAIFDTLATVQALNDAASGGHPVGQQIVAHIDTLEREFTVLANDDSFTSHIVSPLIRRTRQLQQHPDTPLLHLAQIWAAGICTLRYFAMLGAIPVALIQDREVSGELRTHSTHHLSMWKRLLAEAPE